MDQRGDYDEYAPTYAWARSAVSWVLAPIVAEAKTLHPGSVVLEVGCGTGNYVRALESIVPAISLFGLDVSEPMLRQAGDPTASVALVRADASTAIPFRGGTIAFTFLVDVIHHLSDPERFFVEAARVLEGSGRLTVVTDTLENLPRRSMPRFFPEVLDVERRRLPAGDRVHGAARAAGFELRSDQTVAGAIELTDTFLAQLEAKCSSALRLLPPSAHVAGMARVRDAQARGERWISSYAVFHYGRASRSSNR
jgi:SAM-dependent methyltransferase